ncbi:MAG: 3-hydroxyacyl-CoA dehydrogenase [Micrococcales bacterium]|nr:MAG: 3-hydroxyacyl-CoA dehydrogenase [Micrococcales bacterium]PIE26958.1 MAG: 3-hydroxyacyl-CoA dehydrogenase [Micrococcales bacterium]
MSTGQQHAKQEIVTQFLARDVELPDGAGTMALITMDNGHDHRRPATLGPQGMANFEETLKQIEPRAQAGEITAVGITGESQVFAAGADLGQAVRITSRADARPTAAIGHRTMRQFTDMPVPSFAFVNGVALGGGLEIALNCDYRTISSGAGAVGLPETVLGLVPGWGGAYLLPRLVGVTEALRIIVQNPLEQNRMTKPEEALNLGIADAMFSPAGFLENSLQWAAGVLNGTVEVNRRTVDLDDGTAWDAAVGMAEELLDARTGAVPKAPYRALELIQAARTSDRDTAFAAEDDALVDLIMTDEFRAGVYSFDLVQSRAKHPAGAPDPDLARPVTKIGVVGAGLMAAQLALLFARRLAVPVVLTDLDAERVDQGIAGLRNQLDSLVSKGQMSEDEAARVHSLVSGSTDKRAFADADFVIEAVFEQMPVKKQVFAEVEAVVGAECVLATNTSSLSVTRMAEDLAHPHRLVGFHFFNPVAVMPLLEVVRAERTDDVTLATAFALAKQLQKTAVLAKDSTSFIVNRMLGTVFGEAAGMVDEGTAPQDIDAATAGILPMPPFELLELVGTAIALHNADSLVASWPDRFAVPQSLRDVVGAGVPSYYAPAEKSARRPGMRRELDPRLSGLVRQGDSSLDPEQIRRRFLASLATEARIMIDDGVVAAPQDLDLAMIAGAGFLFWNGGITALLDRTGIAEEVTGRRFLPPGVASLPQ